MFTHAAIGVCRVHQALATTECVMLAGVKISANKSQELSAVLAFLLLCFLLSGLVHMLQLVAGSAASLPGSCGDAPNIEGGVSLIGRQAVENLRRAFCIFHTHWGQ